MFNVGLLIFVQVYFNELLAVELNAYAFADDFNGIYQILKKGIVYSCEGTTPRPLLLVLGASLTSGLGQDFSLADKHNVLARELLLQFAYQPSLNLLECLQFWHRYINDDGL